MSTVPTFSIIFPTYNRRDTVEQTLRRLLAVDYPSDHYEIILVDNSSDGTPDMAEAVSAEVGGARVVVLRVDERLPAVKRNLGLRTARFDYVLYLNDDCWVGPEFLREHATTHRNHGAPVAVLGRLDQSPAMEQTPFVEFFVPFGYDQLVGREDRVVPHWYFWSMNISVPREVQIARNLTFHEDWREIGHEDVELGYRWDQAGYEIVYNPRAFGEHFHPHSLDSACRLQESIGRGVRDLESLIPEKSLLERYGIFDWRNSWRSITRGLMRKALFNRVTVPPAKRWLERRDRNSELTRWMYWKVMLHYTERGYRSQPPRSVDPLPIRRLERAS